MAYPALTREVASTNARSAVGRRGPPTAIAPTGYAAAETRLRRITPLASGCTGQEQSQPADLLSRAAPVLQKRMSVMRKVVSFALIGLVNTAVDASVFFLVYAYLRQSAPVSQFFTTAAGLCRCGTAESLVLVTANVTAWLVAMTFSYLMNSSITFAAESGRKLTLRAYLAFAASGVLGVIANTATLVLAAQFLPVWAAKGCAILLSFIVNFSMSHFVVFRPQRPMGSVHY